MRYRYVFTEWFERNLRHLHRHNPHLRRDLTEFLQGFDAEAHPIVAGTGGARKARMKISGRGKSGG
jgi:mRNA-degrading endonuclease RelE of RelBE toxin-antitoxin system